MVFLLWILSILNYGFASILNHDLATDINSYEPEYFPNIPNENTLNKYINDPNTHEVDTDYDTFKDHILSILHSENSNRVVLETMYAKKHGPNPIEDARLKRGNINDIDSNDYTMRGDNNRLEAKSLKKRSAMKALKDLFHGDSISNTPTNKTFNATYLQSLHQLRSTHDVNSSSEFAEIAMNLTDAIKTLNKNLRNLQLQVTSNDAYIMLKVPIDKSQINIRQGEENASKFKRDVKSDHLFDELKLESKYDDDKDKLVVKITEKSMATPSADNYLKQAHETATDKPKTGHKSNEANTNISKREVKTKETFITEEINKDKSNEDSITANMTETDSTTVLEGNTKLPLKTDSKEDLIDDNSTKDKEVDSQEIHVVVLRASNKSIDINSNNSIELRANETKLTNNTEEESSQTKPSHFSRSFTSEEETEFNDLTRSLNPKEHMIFNIDSTLEDIKEQMLPVNYVKQKYSTKVIYKIGYITASLDTLEITLRKLKMKLASNKGTNNNNNIWVLKKLLRVYKKLQLTKQLVANVMSHLDSYTAKEQNLVTEY